MSNIDSNVIIKVNPAGDPSPAAKQQSRWDEVDENGKPVQGSTEKARNEIVQNLGGLDKRYLTGHGLRLKIHNRRG